MGASNRLVAEATMGLEASIPWLLVRVRPDMVTMGCIRMVLVRVKFCWEGNRSNLDRK